LKLLLLIIIKAHLLEKHTLGKWQQYWKEQLGNWYGMLFHEGQFLDPVMRNIETFLEDTQKNSKWNGNGNIETVSLYT
jgi:argininosuccinate synthase